MTARTREEGASLIQRSRATVAMARMLRVEHRRIASLWQANLDAFLEGFARFEDHLKTCRVCDGAEPAPLDCVFSLACRIDHTQAMAVWRGSRLVADPLLIDRAQLLIDLGESFVLEGCECKVVAGFDEPLQAALTLLRAADHVVAFRYRIADLSESFHAIAHSG